MNKINFGRVLLGGIVAGFVLNIGEFVLNGVLLRDRDAKRHETDGSYAARHWFRLARRGADFHFRHSGRGAIRDDPIASGARSEDGAYCRADTVVLFVCLQRHDKYDVDSVPPKIIVMILGWGLIEYPLGILAGAAVYKEA